MSRSRGTRKQTVRDLSRISPTHKETEEIISVFEQAHPIVTAILGTALVEHELDLLLRRKLLRPDSDTEWARLTSDDGPLGTFSQKTLCAHVLKLFDDATKRNIDIIRVIRNQFAHTKRLINFENPLIVAELKKVQYTRKRWHRLQAKLLADPKNAQQAFANVCSIVAASLIKKRSRAIKASNERMKRKAEKWELKNSYLKPLLPFLQPLGGVANLGTLSPYPSEGLGLTPLLSQPGQTVGPKRSTPRLFGLAELGREPKSADKKDK
jgi:hypothetical protein